jgi:hypothetical protein
MADVKHPTAGDIEALLAFLPLLEGGGFSAGRWTGKERDGEVVASPTFRPSEEMSRFVQTAYDGGWVVPFDWPKWEKNSTKYIEKPEALNDADLNELRRLLTTHVRKDRFCEGHLAEMVECGHIEAILKRLRDIRDKAA